MNRNKQSVLKQLLLSFLGFGALMGAVFPFYANFFVHWQEGMLPWFVVGCLVAGLTIGVVNYALVNKVLLSHFRKIAQASNRIASGDLSHSIPLKSHDVVGEIVDSVNQMSSQLREVLRETAQATQKLSEDTERLQLLATDADQGSVQQRQLTDELNHAMNELVQVISEVSHSSSTAAKATNEAGDECCQCVKVVDGAVQGIGDLASDVDQAKIAAEQLNQESSSIGDVASVINGIAEQTNLLALNAAIEAARAGEQGRGFAVVADEVRSLASRTQHSTQEIQQMTERLQQAIGKIVVAMDSAQQKAQQGITCISRAADDLKQVRHRITTIDEMNQQVAEAAVQQNHYADENRRSVERIALLSSETTESAGNLKEASSRLGSMTHQLNQLMGRFQL